MKEIILIILTIIKIILSIISLFVSKKEKDSR